MKKKQVGRPHSENNADKVLPPVRVTSDQKTKYKAAAKKSNLSLSAWIKKIADENS